MDTLPYTLIYRDDGLWEVTFELDGATHRLVYIAESPEGARWQADHTWATIMALQGVKETKSMGYRMAVLTCGHTRRIGWGTVLEDGGLIPCTPCKKRFLKEVAACPWSAR